jgi:hypothetical protein
VAAKAIRHRIPVNLRHHWKLVAGSVGLVAVLILVLGSLRASALVYSDAAEGFTVNWDVQGTVDLFDTSVAHEISLEYDEDDYQQMVETFKDSGEKEWIKADITIDGVTIADVGIRLKGNSTLQSLGGGDQQGGGQPPGGGQGEGGQPPGDGEGGRPPATAKAVEAREKVRSSSRAAARGSNSASTNRSRCRGWSTSPSMSTGRSTKATSRSACESNRRERALR